MRGAETHRSTGAVARNRRWSGHVTLAWIAIGAVFAAIGAASERLASVWPSVEARRRPAGWRTVALATIAGLAAAAVVASCLAGASGSVLPEK